MRKVNTKTLVITTYNHGDFMIEITTTEGFHEAWIYRKGYDTKKHMYCVNANIATIDKLKKMVESDLDEYERRYDQERSRR